MINFKSSILVILFCTLTCNVVARDTADHSYKRLIENGIELEIHEVRPENGLKYVNRIDIIDNGVVKYTKHLKGHISIDDSMRYLALYPCKEVWCASKIQLFKLPEFKELEPIVAPDGNVFLKMKWDETVLHLKYGTGLRKDSKVMSIDVANQKYQTILNQEE